MSAPIVVYDKDFDETEDGLYKRAETNELGILKTVDDVIASDAACVFVHVLETATDRGWTRLCEKLPESRVALRFSSTAGFPPRRAEGKHGNCFHCLKPTKKQGKLSPDEFKLLIDFFGDAASLKVLREGNIPPSLRGLISFQIPHRLRALHILQQACLAEWASDRFGPHAAEASTLLNSCDLPPRPNLRVNRAQLFFRLVADNNSKLSELSAADKAAIDCETVKKIAEELGFRPGALDEPMPVMRQLVEAILRRDEDQALPWDVVQPVFLALEKVLGIRDHEKS
jgi:hypothetical protein